MWHEKNHRRGPRALARHPGEPGDAGELPEREAWPLPACGEGKDRFRFDDREGRGSWICSRCGAGDGMGLAMRFTGLGFADAASKVDEIIRNVKPDSVRPKREMTDGERQAALRRCGPRRRKAEEGDLLHAYLASRGLSVDVPDDLRLAPKIRDGEGGIRPAMVALVRDGDGKPVTLHRTFLKPDGSGKAEMPCPRKLMPGPVPEGSAIRLGPVQEVLGVAEGIETALAASMLFEIPVWSTISTRADGLVEPAGGRFRGLHLRGLRRGVRRPSGRLHPGPPDQRQGRGGRPAAQAPGDWNDVAAGKDRGMSIHKACPSPDAAPRDLPAPAMSDRAKQCTE